MQRSRSAEVVDAEAVVAFLEVAAEEEDFRMEEAGAGFHGAVRGQLVLR